MFMGQDPWMASVFLKYKMYAYCNFAFTLTGNLFYWSRNLFKRYSMSL